mgnify:CR=1 FL=1
MKITLRAIGRLKVGPLSDLLKMYTTRMRAQVFIEELEARKKGSALEVQEEEARLLLGGRVEGAYVIALDERGKTLTSESFANLLEEQTVRGCSHFMFLIGGADGLTPQVRQQADYVMSFGSMVWPHMLIRVMLMEQLYRAQQITAGHPYHRGDG